MSSPLTSSPSHRFCPPSKRSRRIALKSPLVAGAGPFPAPPAITLSSPEPRPLSHSHFDAGDSFHGGPLLHNHPGTTSPDLYCLEFLFHPTVGGEKIPSDVGDYFSWSQLYPSQRFLLTPKWGTVGLITRLIVN